MPLCDTHIRCRACNDQIWVLVMNSPKPYWKSSCPKPITLTGRTNIGSQIDVWTKVWGTFWVAGISSSRDLRLDLERNFVITSARLYLTCNNLLNEVTSNENRFPQADEVTCYSSVVISSFHTIHSYNIPLPQKPRRSHELSHLIKPTLRGGDSPAASRIVGGGNSAGGHRENRA